MPYSSLETIANEFVLIGNTLARGAANAQESIGSCPEYIDETAGQLIEGEQGQLFLSQPEAMPIEFTGDAPGLTADLDRINGLKDFTLLSSICLPGKAVAESRQMALFETPSGTISLELISNHDDHYANNTLSSIIWHPRKTAIDDWKNVVRERVTEFVAASYRILDALVANEPNDKALGA